MSQLHRIVLGGLFVALGAQSRALAQVTPPARVTQSCTSAIDEEAFLQEYPDALLYKGLYLFEAGCHVEAAEAWERFLAAAQAGRDTASVILLIEEAVSRAFPDWLLYRGLALFETGDFRGAERVWTRYLEVGPTDADCDGVRSLIAEARAARRSRPAASGNTP